MLSVIQQVAGINTVMYYSATIIQMSGVRDKSEAVWLSSLTSAANFLCTFIGFFAVERLGRRPLFLLSLGGVFVSLVTLGVGFQLMDVSTVTKNINSWIVLAGLILYLVCFAPGKNLSI